MILRMKLGPDIIQFDTEEQPKDLQFDHVKPFLYTGKETSNLMLRIRKDPPPPAQGVTLLAECPRNWRFYRSKTGYRFEVIEQLKFEVRQVLLLDRSLSKAEVYSFPWLASLDPLVWHTGWYINEILVPFFRWWQTRRMALGEQGVHLHGAAVLLNDQGVAFFGPSGAGKTTLARLCRDVAGATVLNDERTVIWSDGSCLRVSGSPWHGEWPEVSAVSAPLKWFFVLNKGPENRFVRFSVNQLLPHVLQEAYLPIWDAQAMEQLVGVVETIAQQVPSGELTFVHDPSVVEYLENISAEVQPPVSEGVL